MFQRIIKFPSSVDRLRIRALVPEPCLRTVHIAPLSDIWCPRDNLKLSDVLYNCYGISNLFTKDEWFTF
jgi:hypothetical protein